MTYPAPRIAVTVTQTIPANLGSQLGLSGAQLNVGAALSLPQNDALQLVRGGYAQLGSDTNMPGSATGARIVVTVVKTITQPVADQLGLTAGQMVVGQELTLKADDALFLVRNDFAQIRQAADTGKANTGGVQGVHSASLDFPSVAAGAAAALTIAAPGARAGDPVIVGAPAALPAGVIPVGFVSANDVVTIRVENQSAAPVDLAAATWKAAIIKGAAH